MSSIRKTDAGTGAGDIYLHDDQKDDLDQPKTTDVRSLQTQFQNLEAKRSKISIVARSAGRVFTSAANAAFGGLIQSVKTKIVSTVFNGIRKLFGRRKKRRRVDPNTINFGSPIHRQADNSEANLYLQAARALLRAIAMNTRRATNPNPIVQIAKNLTNKSLGERAISYLEAASTLTHLSGSPINQQIIFTKFQASTIVGEATANVAFWKQVLEENKALQKQSHDLAKGA